MKTFIVDSFTDEAFKGNPAGVCIVKTDLSDTQMLCIAQELNLSETAFIRPLKAENSYSIRYFSPKMEIPLCGHATLASAKVVFTTRDTKQVHFKNIQNLDLRARECDGEITMEFPIYETTPAEVPQKLLNSLGINSVNNVVYNRETNILLLEIDDAGRLASLDPNFSALYRSHDSISGVLVTAPSGDGRYDFHSRYFWPWSGTNEDPVTGGTHTFLAKYWSERLGKNKMRSFQSSKRTGFMEVELAEGKLLIKSQAIIVFQGELKNI